MNDLISENILKISYLHYLYNFLYSNTCENFYCSLYRSISSQSPSHTAIKLFQFKRFYKKMGLEDLRL